MRPVGSFVFIDESGVLGTGAQRFFGLGLLKAQDTAPLTEAVHLSLDAARQKTPSSAGKRSTSRMPYVRPPLVDRLPRALSAAGPGVYIF